MNVAGTGIVDLITQPEPRDSAPVEKGPVTDGVKSDFKSHMESCMSCDGKAMKVEEDREDFEVKGKEPKIKELRNILIAAWTINGIDRYLDEPSELSAALQNEKGSSDLKKMVEDMVSSLNTTLEKILSSIDPTILQGLEETAPEQGGAFQKILRLLQAMQEGSTSLNAGDGQLQDFTMAGEGTAAANKGAKGELDLLSLQQDNAARADGTNFQETMDDQESLIKIKSIVELEVGEGKQFDLEGISTDLTGGSHSDEATPLLSSTGGLHSSKSGVINPQEGTAPAASLSKTFNLPQGEGFNDRHLLIELEPPDLGKVMIHLKMEGGLLKADIKVQHGGIKDLFSYAMPQIRESLEKMGIRPGEFHLSHREDSYQDGSYQKNWGEQKGQGSRQEQEFDPTSS